MEAVRNNRIVIIDYGLINPGVRNHLGVLAVARGLFTESFEE
jgi:hypothetical protein